MNTITQAEEKTLTNLTRAEVDELMKAEHGKGVELIYIDYRDCIESKEDIEMLVNEEDGEQKWFEKADWQFNSQFESINYIIRELEENKEVEYTEDTKELIKDWCYEHDTSEPLKQLLHNTGKKYFYYDLGIEFGEMDWSGQEKETKSRVSQIMKVLRTRNKETEKSVREVVENAGYGGQLVILFEDDIDNLIGHGEVIAFGEKAEICLMDRCNGSGHSASLRTKIACAFDRDNLHSDDGAGGYSFTNEVCGLTGGFMDGGVLRKVRWNDKLIGVIKNEEAIARMTREKEYAEKWRKTGKCSAGDMNIKRHKNTPYRNEYPCGNKCEECGTFWID